MYNIDFLCQTLIFNMTKCLYVIGSVVRTNLESCSNAQSNYSPPHSGNPCCPKPPVAFPSAKINFFVKLMKRMYKKRDFSESLL